MGIQCYNGNIMVHYMNYGYIMGINYKATYDLYWLRTNQHGNGQYFV